MESRGCLLNEVSFKDVLTNANIFASPAFFISSQFCLQYIIHDFIDTNTLKFGDQVYQPEAQVLRLQIDVKWQLLYLFRKQN